MISVQSSKEVQKALEKGRPMVALESTIISHGMPFPRNVETALKVEAAVRESGAVPATIAIIGGRLRAGLSKSEIEYLGKRGREVLKVSRRDLPVVMAKGLDGATTVASTMIIARMAGIPVFATGGIGGVHRGGELSMDISADLQELARTNVAVISAGVKSILDIGRTLEYLETQGVPVLGFGTDEFPAFYTRRSGHGVDYRMDDPDGIASAMHYKWAMGLEGGILIANPVPQEFQMEGERIDAAIRQALRDCADSGIKGKGITPFLLAKVKEITGGDSLETNIQLVLNNAAVAARIAVAYAGLGSL